MTDQPYISDQHDKPTRDALTGLISNCLKGSRTAQKQLYDTYAPFLYGVIRRYLFDQAASGEVLNDAFYRIFTKLDQYSFKGSFEGWMRKIVINIITDHIRLHVKHEVVVANSVEEYNPSIEDTAIQKLSYKELLAMIHELPDTQRAVFNLYVFEDYSHKEIAENIGITENNSRWHLNDARRRLKEKITKTM